MLQAAQLFRHQRRALSVLLGWGAGSLTLGALWRRERQPLLRGLGLQFCASGLLAALLALGGLLLADINQRRLVAGALGAADLARHMRYTQAVLRASIPLDLLYAGAGALLLPGAGHDGERRGLGWGAIVQGGFYLGFDTASLLRLRSLTRSELETRNSKLETRNWNLVRPAGRTDERCRTGPGSYAAPLLGHMPDVL